MLLERSCRELPEHVSFGFGITLGAEQLRYKRRRSRGGVLSCVLPTVAVPRLGGVVLRPVIGSEAGKLTWLVVGNAICFMLFNHSLAWRGRLRIPGSLDRIHALNFL